MSDENAEYGLIVSFEDQSPSYVNGFEAGGIWERLRSGNEAEIEVTIHTANRETVSRMCVAEGWSVEFKGTEYEEWTEAKLSKTGKAPERPNPHGLRLVSP